MNKDNFYKELSVILDRPFQASSKLKKTRWGPREPGPGRFDGFGTCRWFSSNSIHLSFYFPERIQKTFSSPEEALSFIRLLLKKDI